LITVNRPLAQLRPVVEAFREGGGEGKPLRLQYHLSWAPTVQQARAFAVDQWRHGALPPDRLWDLEFPEQFDAATAALTADDLTDAIAIDADPSRHAELIAATFELGFDHVMLHNVGPNQNEFIDTFTDNVLPNLK